MVFWANLGVNLHVCLCGDLQVASAQTLDFLDIGQKSSFPDWKLGSTGKSFPDGHEVFSKISTGTPPSPFLERPCLFPEPYSPILQANEIGIPIYLDNGSFAVDGPNGVADLEGFFSRRLRLRGAGL